MIRELRGEDCDVLVAGVLRETASGERRVAVTPDTVPRLLALGVEVRIETGAGAAAAFTDEQYEAAGARLVDRGELCTSSDILLCVRGPEPDTVNGFVPQQVLIGLLQPLVETAYVRELAEAKVTAVSLDGIPRTLSRAQAMDALSSQANVAGYKAAVLAADTYAGYFPMLMTAAGTIRPAKVLVLGAGVAGLQAIATSRRLGAIVSGYDVRDAARADITSAGATLLDLGTTAGTGEGGYARQLTDEEQQAQQAALNDKIAGFDVVITTAQVPGAKPPLLVTGETVARLQPGSVVVDLAAGPFGGNVEGSVPDQTVVTGSGVTIIGAGNLPAQVPRAASTAYARNLSSLLGHLLRDGAFAWDVTDEITAGVLVTHEGAVVHPGVAARMPARPEVSPEATEEDVS